MPTLSVTLTAAQVTRVRNAVPPDQDADGNDLPVTQATVEVLVKSYLKGLVIQAEAGQADKTTREAVEAEVW